LGTTVGTLSDPPPQAATSKLAAASDAKLAIRADIGREA
jgi:hypothetical protein